MASMPPIVLSAEPNRVVRAIIFLPPAGYIVGIGGLRLGTFVVLALWSWFVARCPQH